ncbi:MAG TPA: FAD-binding oxidoreductase [bacterium]
MRLFDRYAKLRDAVQTGTVHTGQKEILTFLKGRLGKEDLPDVVVEPANDEELRAVFEYAASKEMKVAVASGLRPVEVRDLKGQTLVLTTRMMGTPAFSASRSSVRVNGGLPLEALAIDLTRAGQRWVPLMPVPARTSVGEMLATGWEGLRNWRDGGVLSHISAVEWMGTDGVVHRTGPAVATAAALDVSGFLFGSRGTAGVITALELNVQPAPQSRASGLFELPSARAAVEVMAALREFEPLAETVIYWGEAATDVLRKGNDGTVSDKAAVLISAEWRDEIRWPDAWRAFGRPFFDDLAIDALWQDLFRFSRTAARLYPERTTARLRVPAPSVPELEEAVKELGRDFNFPVALWGTVEAGHMNVWILQPDAEPRTTVRAEELLKKIIEVAVTLGGCCAAGNLLPFDIRNGRTSITRTLREQFLKKCDPAGVVVPLCK